jgi:hypothetical protein
MEAWPVTCTTPHSPQTPTNPQVPKTTPSRRSTSTAPMRSNQNIWAFTPKFEIGAAGQGFLPVTATHRQHPTIPRARGRPQSRRSGAQQSWWRYRSFRSSTRWRCAVRTAIDAAPHPRPPLAVKAASPHRAGPPPRNPEPPPRKPPEQATRTSSLAVGEGSPSSRRLGHGKPSVVFLHLATAGGGGCREPRSPCYGGM